MAMVLQKDQKAFFHNYSMKEGLQNFLSEDNFKKLQNIMYSKEVSAGSYLFLEGEKAEKMYFIHSGKVKLKMYSEGGKELMLSIKKENSLLGEFAGLDEDEHYNYVAKVIEDANVGIIPQKDLKKLLYQFGNFAVEFMSWVSWSHRMTQRKLYDVIFYDNAGALASTLIQLTASYGVKCKDGIIIGIELTNKEYADFIGTSRESVNRILNTWKKEGIIDFSNKQIVIRRFDKLSFICGCA